MDETSPAQADPDPKAGHTMSKPIIAVFNSSNDTVELLRTALEGQGFHTVVGHIPEVKSGELDLVSFIEHHAPAITCVQSSTCIPLSGPEERDVAVMRCPPAMQRVSCYQHAPCDASRSRPRQRWREASFAAAQPHATADRPAGPETCTRKRYMLRSSPVPIDASAAERAPDAKREGSEQRRRSSATPSSGATEQRSRWGTIGSRHQTGSDGRASSDARKVRTPQGRVAANGGPS